jgi:hypothetical protein
MRNWNNARGVQGARNELAVLMILARLVVAIFLQVLVQNASAATASHIIKGDDSAIIARLAQTLMNEIAISVVTEAELRYGVKKRGNPADLSTRVREFLISVEVCP